MTSNYIARRESHSSKLSAIWYSALFLFVCGCRAEVEQKQVTNDRSGKSNEIVGSVPVAPVPPMAPESSEQLLSTCKTALKAGNLDLAAEKAKQYLLGKPDEPQGLFLAAEIEARRQRYSDAIALLDLIPRDDPQAGIAALGQSADWLLAAERFDEAEKRFDEVLSLIPNASMAHRRLAYLLNRKGRRQEACFHIEHLCRAGDVSMSELLNLISRSDAVYDESKPGESRETGGVGEDYSPVGTAAEARILFSKGDFKAALKLLKGSMSSGSLDDPGKAFFGRIAVEAQDDDAIGLWFGSLGKEQEKYSDYWVALGSFELQRGDNIKGATRFLSEAIVRNPTDWGTLSKLENCMVLLGNEKQGMKFRSQATLIRKTIHLGNRISGRSNPDQKTISELADVLDALGRPFEAVMWRAIGIVYSKGAQSDVQKLDHVRRNLLSDRSLKKSHEILLADLDLDEYPLSPKPTFTSRNEQSRKQFSAAHARPRMVDVSRAIGLEFQYLNAKKPKLRDTQIYEQFGGGVVAFDYDRNGRPDLYFAQGGADPKVASLHPNALLRNLGGGFVDAKSSLAGDFGYGQGVTSGDWNQDGFPDLVVANFGVNVLFINNGDGTFGRANVNEDWKIALWTTSIAMADVTSDGLPDIVETNYINDKSVHEITQKGADGRFVKFKGPESYRPAQDRIFVGDPAGLVSDVSLGSGKRSHGLGLVITDIDGEVGNEIFVANDTDPNQLWVQTGKFDKQTEAFVDVAGIRGCSFSARGGNGASMGVATADFDRNGEIDFHITNFFNESVHLYLQDRKMFTDEPIKADLYQPSLQSLGFGTQALDFDNNSAIDIAVLNGHIDDLQFKGSPHKMLPQLFSGFVGRFQQVGESDLSDFWQRPTIGRGLAKLDWNCDGKMDLIATHHDVPASLLENQTGTKHHWLQLSLVGTESERDAIGARVTISCGEEDFVEFVTAGDGYACKNEPILAFGLGEISTVDQVDVRWPSGTQQSFRVDDVDCRYLLIEGDKSAFRCSLSSE